MTFDETEWPDMHYFRNDFITILKKWIFAAGDLGIHGVVLMVEPM